jgi:outer membrane receptor for ferric coprogen and ferric-rhodotorulic acid
MFSKSLAATAACRPRQSPRPTPIARAIRLLLCGAALAGAAHHLPAMAEETTQTQAGKSYDIPPGSLDQVLGRFGRETGLMIAIDADLTAGQNSPGLNGRYTPTAGLDAILRPHGLEAVPGINGGYRLKRLPVVNKGGEATLAPVTVTAEAVRDGTTEGTGSYKARYTNTATKLNLSPRETPQTVTVVTRQQMDDFGLTSVDDALKTASGIFVGDRGDNGSVYYSRGFEMQSQYDGIPNPIGIGESNQNPQVDNVFLDRVEVLQGAAGLLTGAGAPGGTINLVRKRPTETFQAQTEVQLGSWDQRRIVGDISGPLIASGNIRGRLVALADDSDSFVDYVYRNRRAAYGIVEADLTPETTISASIQYQKDTGRNQLGVPFAADGSEPGLSRSSYFGDANNRAIKSYTLYAVELSHRFSNDWRLKTAYTHQKTSNDTYNYGFISGDLDVSTGNGMVIYRQPLLAQQYETDALDAYLSGPIEILGRKHELAFGINGSNKTSTWQGGYGTPVAFNAFTFNPADLGPITSVGSYAGETKTTQLGMYGVGRFSLSDSLKLITGVRVSDYEDKDVLAGTTNTKESGVVTPYAGLIYDVNEQYSVYASYSDIFNPQSYRSAGGSYLKPVLGSNYEAGIKGELLNKRLNVAAAVFRLEQTNLPKVDDSIPYSATNACGGNCYIAADKVVSQGVDLSANGEIAPGWNVTTGYTFVNSKYATGENEGQRYMTSLPRHSLRLASAYKLPGTSWTVGGNVTAYSKAYTDGTSWISGNAYTIRRGELALVGLMAKYQIDPKTEVIMNVSNLFDRSYRAHLENRNYSTFGEPRNFSIALKYRF